MSDLTLAGVTFDPDDFNNYGWLDNVTVEGVARIRILSLFAAAMADLGKALTVDATGSIDFDAVTVGSSGSITLTANRPFRTNSIVTITDSSDSGNYLVAQVTADVTATTLSYTIQKVTASSAGGVGTAFTVQIAGEIGATGAAGTGMVVDTAANQAVVNPTVANTVYFESDTGRAKIGDGSTAYSSLAYVDGLEGVNSSSFGGALTPDSSGTIVVDISDLSTVKDIQPSSNDTINVTNSPAGKTTMFEFIMTNGGGKTLTWQLDGNAATVTLDGSFTFTTSGTDHCVGSIYRQASGDYIINIFRIGEGV